MSRWARLLAGFTPLIVVMVVWQLFGPQNSAFFPPPSDWFHSLASRGWGTIGEAIWASLTRFAGGIGVGLVLGWALGLLIGRVPALDLAMSPTLEFFRATPAPAIIPLVILFVGPGVATVVIAVAVAALWPVLLNVVQSARSIEPILEDVAQTLQLTRRQRLRQVVIPAVTPGAFVGLRVALPIALIVTLLAEMLTGGGGLGGRLLMAQRTYESDTAYGLLVTAGLLGLLLSWAFGTIEERLHRTWGTAPSS